MCEGICVRERRMSLKFWTGKSKKKKIIIEARKTISGSWSLYREPEKKKH